MAKPNFAKYIETIDFANKRLVLAGIVGLVVGALSWLLSLLLQNVFVEPVFCRSADAFAACANGGTISMALALFVTNIIGLFALVKIGVYRPLLVIIAALATIVGLHLWLGGLGWLEAAVWYAIVFAIAYVLYAWIARLASFGSAIAAMLVVIVAIRILMTQL